MASTDSPPQRIAILGVGLIGGSLGLALKASGSDIVVCGCDEADVLKVALRRGAIDTLAATPEKAVADADIVVLATPLASALKVLPRIAPHLKVNAVVTDVGSVKQPIGQHASRHLPEHVSFVGGHPMTGSEKRGIEHADALLFENAVYALCPQTSTAAGFEAVSTMVETVGARVLVLEAKAHDTAAARISHIPQLLAICLVNQMAGDAVSAQLAAGGFRDMTRIASSSFSMWRDIIVANQGSILDELARFSASLERLRNRIAESDMDAVEARFQMASDLRSTVPASSKGFLKPLSDVFVYTSDQPGALLRITGTLSDQNADIKDIELLKIREGTGGTFRLGFSGDEAAENAVDILSRAGFHAYRL
jgi:prephenate dehydrogenase